MGTDERQKHLGRIPIPVRNEILKLVHGEGGIMNYLKIKKILEDKGFDITKEGESWFIHQYTPAGEDWGIYVHQLKDIVYYAQNFEKEDAFKMWVEAKYYSKVGGIPDPDELWQDQQWKENILKEIAEEIR